MKVIKVKKEDTAIINFIIENIFDNSDEKPTTNHLEKLLTDDRTYLLAAVFEDNVVGYVRWPNFDGHEIPINLQSLWNRN